MLLLEKFREKKAELHLTNAKIAELSGLPLPTVNSVFSGQVQSPNLITAGAICKVLGISLDSHLGITNDEMDATEIARIEAEYQQNESELKAKLQEYTQNILLHEKDLKNDQEIIRRQDLRIFNLEDRIKSQVHVINIFRVWILALHIYGFLMDSMVPDAGLIRGIAWGDTVEKTGVILAAVSVCVGIYFIIRLVMHKIKTKKSISSR